MYCGIVHYAPYFYISTSSSIQLGTSETSGYRATSKSPSCFCINGNFVRRSITTSFTTLSALQRSPQKSLNACLECLHGANAQVRIRSVRIRAYLPQTPCNIQQLPLSVDVLTFPYNSNILNPSNEQLQSLHVSSYAYVSHNVIPT